MWCGSVILTSHVCMCCELCCSYTGQQKFVMNYVCVCGIGRPRVCAVLLRVEDPSCRGLSFYRHIETDLGASVVHWQIHRPGPKRLWYRQVAVVFIRISGWVSGSACSVQWQPNCCILISSWLELSQSPRLLYKHYFHKNHHTMSAKSMSTVNQL